MKKTFIGWLKSLANDPVRTKKKAVRMIMYRSLAANYNGTDDCDLAGLWMTKALRIETELKDNT